MKDYDDGECVSCNLLSAGMAKLRAERDELAAKLTSFTLERSIRQMTEKRNTELLNQYDELAAQVEVMREALIRLGEHDQQCDVFDLDDDGRHKSCSCGFESALSNAGAAAILRQRDARTAAQALRDYVTTIPGGSIVDPQWIADDMRRVADQLERKNG